MKKVKISILIFMIVLCMFTKVDAITKYVTIEGTSAVETGKENVAIVKVSNNTAVDVVKGSIKTDSGIEVIKVSALHNGWSTTYEKKTGSFNAFKPEGATDGETLKITYILKEGYTQGTITITDVELTTRTNDKIKVQTNTEKTIKKVAGNLNNTGTGVVVPTVKPTTPPTITPSITPSVKPNDAIADEKVNASLGELSKATIKPSLDNTLATTPLPQTGLSDTIPAIIIAFVVLSLIFFARTRYYRDI